FSKTYINDNYYTQNQSNDRYYTKTYINDNILLNNGGTFNGNLRVKGNLFIGNDNPNGTGISTDKAYLQYLGYGGTDSKKTVLRINVESNNLTSTIQDNINLNPTGGVGINTDD
ncbi:MAG: hypothetical protein ACKO96_46135, partial [Flammeovirgaceae bacterium]